MVPHGTVEQRTIEGFGWDSDEGATAVVTGIPDPVKGEALVLLTTHELTADELRAKLLEMGLPNLWIPRIVLQVPAIPVLGSGKIDLKACRQLAMEKSKPETA